MKCHELEEKLPLYLYDELPTEGRRACDDHIAACPGCRAVLDETRRLHQGLSRRPIPEPNAEFLTRCREALEDALDRELSKVTWRDLLRDWVSSVTAIPAPRAVTALTLAVFGFTLGWGLRSRVGGGQPAGGGVLTSSFLGPDLGNLRISSISQVSPGPQTGEVRITLNAERRVTLEGSLDDPRIRQVLVDAVKSYDNAGIRRDTLDVLRAQTDRPPVREALLYALGNDPNAGVRMEALKAVRGMEYRSDVHQALLGVLERDTNPGVRVGAIDELVTHAEGETTDPSALHLFERLAANDANPYVRMKCQSAARKLAPNNF